MIIDINIDINLSLILLEIKSAKPNPERITPNIIAGIENVLPI
jgi:hypothetical protein